MVNCNLEFVNVLKAVTILQMENLTQGRSTDPKQWLNFFHTVSPRHLSDSRSFLYLNIHVP